MNCFTYAKQYSIQKICRARKKVNVYLLSLYLYIKSLDSISNIQLPNGFYVNVFVFKYTYCDKIYCVHVYLSTKHLLSIFISFVFLTEITWF